MDQALPLILLPQGFTRASMEGGERKLMIDYSRVSIELLSFAKVPLGSIVATLALQCTSTVQ
jgi:hypothetical protein